MSTNTSDTEKTITDPAEIRATFAAWAADDDSHPSELSLVLAPLHDKVWWGDCGTIEDVDGDSLPREVALTAGTGGELAVQVSTAEYENRIVFVTTSEHAIALGPQHVRAIKTNSPLVHREVEGLEYTLTLLPGEGCTVGCQNITRVGCRQIVDILAAHLGLEVRPGAAFRAGDRVRCVREAAFPTDSDEVWVEAMNALIGREGKVVRSIRNMDSVDYLVEFGTTDRWYMPAASLEAV